MIAKRVMKRTNTSCISRLTGYIVGLPETRQPADWPPLIDYITDAVSDGARVDFVRVSSIPSDDLRDAVLAMMHTQEMNTRSKTDKTYHLIFSFPHGKIPSREILNDIEDRLVEAIGLGEHQRISAAHDDKDHYHVHVAINKVHPTSYRNVEPFYDQNALMRTCEELEIKHNLTRTNHGEIIDLTNAKINKNNNQVNNENTHYESLKTWIEKHAKSQLLDALYSAKSWEDLHQAANEFGLEIKPRGAGLIIKAIDQPASIKASSIDRQFSFKELTDKFGEYVPSQPNLPKPIKTYSQNRQTEKGEASNLYLKYQAMRNVALLERASARTANEKRRIDAAASIKTIFNKQRDDIKNNRSLRAYQKRAAFNQLAIDRKKVWEIHSATVKREQEALRTNYQIPNWRGFLRAEELAGNAAATKLLEKISERKMEVSTSGKFVPQSAVVNTRVESPKPISNNGRELEVKVSAIDEFIDNKNAASTNNGIGIHKKWSTSDIGKFEFAGIVSLPDRTNVALLKQGEAIFVKPVSISELQKFSKIPNGKQIALDSYGQVASSGLKR